MSITVATILDGADTFIANVEAATDTVTTATLLAATHGCGTVPEVYLIPLTHHYYISQWRYTIDALGNITCTKGTAVGSGVTGAQLRVIIKRPHSIGI